MILLVELSNVSSVVSNVSSSPDDSSSTAKSVSCPVSSTKITIHGFQSASSTNEPPKGGGHTRTTSKTTQGEGVLLSLCPETPSVASEWLDGLLMLLNQQPITSETNDMIDLVGNYGLKIRLLNVRYDDAIFASDAPNVPSRDGLNEDYYYDVFGGA